MKVRGSSRNESTAVERQRRTTRSKQKEPAGGRREKGQTCMELCGTKQRPGNQSPGTTDRPLLELRVVAPAAGTSVRL